MSEFEKQPENAASAETAAKRPAGKKAGAKVRVVAEAAALLLAVVAVCIVGEVKQLQWWGVFRESLGSAEMQYRVGESYVDSDPAKSEKWFRKAAEKGHVGAIAKLAEIVKDDAERIRLLEMLAEKGHVKVAARLAYTVQDDAKKLALLEMLAKKGDVEVQLGLAQHYNISNRPQEALKWYSVAAAAGEPEAMHMLGIFHRDGIGVPKDAVKAKAWFTKAAAKGYERSKIALSGME